MLKRELVNRDAMCLDARLCGLDDEYNRVARAHFEVERMFPIQRFPDTLYTLCFQDGLMHGLDRVMVRWRTGEYSQVGYAEKMLAEYNELLVERIKTGKFHDASYIEGYMESLMFLGQNERERKNHNRYRLPGANYEISTLREYKAARRKVKVPKTLNKYAERMVNRFAPGVTFHHSPTLF